MQWAWLAWMLVTGAHSAPLPNAKTTTSLGETNSTLTSHPTWWLGMGLIAIATVSVLAHLTYNVVLDGTRDLSDLKWTSDEVTVEVYDAWKRDIERYLLLHGKHVSTNVAPLLLDTYIFKAEDSPLAGRLWVFLDSLIGKGTHMYLLSHKYSKARRGDKLWRAILRAYETRFKKQRHLKASSFYKSPDGRAMDTGEWTSQMAETKRAFEGALPTDDKLPAGWEFQMLKAGFALNANNEKITPSDISDALRSKIIAKIHEIEALPDKQKEVAMRKFGIERVYLMVMEEHTINPPGAAGTALFTADLGHRRQSQGEIARYCWYFHTNVTCPTTAKGKKCNFLHKRAPIGTEVQQPAAARKDRKRGKQATGGNKPKKSKTSHSSSATADTKPKQLCFKWRRGQCSGTCPEGRRHHYTRKEQNDMKAQVMAMGDGNGAAAAAAAPTTPVQTPAPAPAERRRGGMAAALGWLNLVFIFSIMTCPAIVHSTIAYGPAFSSDTAGDGPIFSRPMEIVTDTVYTLPWSDEVTTAGAATKLLFDPRTQRMLSLIADDGEMLKVRDHNDEIFYIAPHHVTEYFPPDPLLLAPPDDQFDEYTSDFDEAADPTMFAAPLIDTVTSDTGEPDITVFDIDHFAYRDDEFYGASNLNPLFEHAMSDDELELVATEAAASMVRDNGRTEAGDHRAAMMAMADAISQPDFDSLDMTPVDSVTLVGDSSSHRLLADQGASRTVVESATILHDVETVRNWSMDDAGTKDHGVRHTVTHTGTLRLRFTSSNGSPFMVDLPAVVVPSIKGQILINTTHLWQHLGWSCTIVPYKGATWRTPAGHETTLITRRGQEYVNATVVCCGARSDVVLAGADSFIQNPAPTRDATHRSKRVRLNATPMTRDAIDGDRPTMVPQPTATATASRLPPPPAVQPPPPPTSMPPPSIPPPPTSMPRPHVAPTTIPTPDTAGGGQAGGAQAAPADTGHSMPASWERSRLTPLPTTPDNRTPLPVKPAFRLALQKIPVGGLLDMLRHTDINRNERDAVRLQLAHLACITTAGADDEFLALHHKLGHISIRDTLATARRLNLPVGKYAGVVCDICARHKSKRKPVAPASDKSGYDPLSSWSIDIYGPTSDYSIFGKTRYLLAAVDKGTRYGIIVPLAGTGQTAVSAALRRFGQEARRARKLAKDCKLAFELGPHPGRLGCHIPVTGVKANHERRRLHRDLHITPIHSSSKFIGRAIPSDSHQFRQMYATGRQPRDGFLPRSCGLRCTDLQRRAAQCTWRHLARRIFNGSTTVHCGASRIRHASVGA